MQEVTIATRGDDGWILGVFKDIDSAKDYVEDEVEHYEPYECDYWLAEVGEGGAELKPR